MNICLVARIILTSILPTPYNYFYANEMMKEISYVFILSGRLSSSRYISWPVITRELDRRVRQQSGFDTLFFLTSKPKERKTSYFKVLFIKWWSIIYSIFHFFSFSFIYRFNRLQLYFYQYIEIKHRMTE